MREIGLSDLDVATRALLTEPEQVWAAIARGLIDEAHAADLWRKRFGSPHPDGGTGSLYAQASLRDRSATSHCTPRYCAALAVVLEALDIWRDRVKSGQDQ